ncbi:RsmB/NOP family class I SAM-dependent RNA methyltransferase [Candidatus Woesearchaeota archaeon]|nr:RsmB/NOP family class I SAM-dependent RNA methyltransferase [Candidatus Woesearchaeota archaeon]
MPKDLSSAPDKIEFKQAFIDRYSALTDWEMFKDISLQFLRRSIRVNTLKTTVEEVKKRLSADWNLVPVPWCREGFWIEHKGDCSGHKRRDIGNLPEHALGYIFIQEAASMIPPVVLDPKAGEMVLDMCASPGSKATQIAQYMQNKGILVANDYKYDRNKALGINIQRMGIHNTVQTLMHGRYFSGNLFDCVLVDAPCSGTGTIRKSFKTLKIWNPNMVRRLSATQKQLIDTGFKNLKPGGTLVYSTCTLEPEEDEGVVDHLLSRHDDARLEKITLNRLVRSSAVTSFNGITFNKEVNKCLRIWPQDNDTEGFFVAKITKARNPG